MSGLQHVSLTVDGTNVTVPAGTTLVDAGRTVGIRIPTLCHLPGRPARGVCRVCSVFVNGRRNLLPACATLAESGMEVETQSPAVLKARRIVLELALAEHGTCDVAVCGGEQRCDLARLARQHGVVNQRFDTIEKPHCDELSSDSIDVRADACILCDRCIQACRDLHVISRAGRGQNTRIIFDADRSMDESDCVACGDCVAVCPVSVFR